MAGKKKVADEAVNKTARKNQQKGKKEGFIPAAPETLKRVIPLGGGTYAYLLDPRDGKTYHLKVGSFGWKTLLAELDSTDYGKQINAELEALGWDQHQ